MDRALDETRTTAIKYGCTIQNPDAPLYFEHFAARRPSQVKSQNASPAIYLENYDILRVLRKKYDVMQYVTWVLGHRSSLTDLMLTWCVVQSMQCNFSTIILGI
jgi:hypothetical protein